MSEFIGSFYGEAEYSIDEYAALRIAVRQLRLFWTASDCPDADYYTVRYAPDTTDVFEDATEIHRTTSFLQFQREETECAVDDRLGKYFVTCTDTSGNESAPAEFVYEDEIPDWEFRTAIQGHPDWVGSRLYMSLQGETLRIAADAPIVDGKYTGYFDAVQPTDFGNETQIRFISDPVLTNNEFTTAVWQYGSPLANPPTWFDLDENDVVKVLNGPLVYRLKVQTTNIAVESGVDFARLLIYTKKDAV